MEIVWTILFELYSKVEAMKLYARISMLLIWCMLGAKTLMRNVSSGHMSLSISSVGLIAAIWIWRDALERNAKAKSVPFYEDCLTLSDSRS